MPYKSGMKYIRQVMAVGLAIIFLIALVIGAGVILSVRNVNVSFIEYSGEYSGTPDSEYEKTRANFNKLKGSGLLFISDGDVYGKVEDTDIFAVESYEKKFPCTVNIVLRERIETFTYKNGDDSYSVYDERGKLIKSVENQPMNTIDGCPNVLLECSADDIEEIATLCGHFKNNFFGEDKPKSFRRLVKRIKTEDRLGFVDIVFNGGLTVSVYDWKTSGAQKIKRACEVYKELDEYQRITGTITVIGGRDGSGPVAKYGE